MVSVGAAYEQGEAKRDYNAYHAEYKSGLSATIYTNMLILQSASFCLFHLHWLQQELQMEDKRTADTWVLFMKPNS